MKTYKCHKTVNAGLIIGVEGASDPRDRLIIHVKGENKPFQFNRDFIARGVPVKNESYLVVYDQGTDKEYYSWSPKDVFEAGYAQQLFLDSIADAKPGSAILTEPAQTLGIADPKSVVQIRDDAFRESCRYAVNSSMWDLWTKICRTADMISAVQFRDEAVRKEKDEVEPAGSNADLSKVTEGDNAQA